MADFCTKKKMPISSIAYHHPYKIEKPITKMTLITSEEIKLIIRSMKNKASTGMDHELSKILKFCETEIITPIAHITNHSLGQGPEKH